LVIETLEEEIKRKRLKLEFKKPKTKLPQVAVDAEKMELVIQNLLSNAIKYTPAGGRVTISLKGSIKEIEVSVTDTGIGIPEDQKKRVFTKFFRAANAIRAETEGTGLGLFIVKNIIKAHQGKIWFESAEGKGTTFYFTLPVKK
jgi:two-component system sensor histidine kinase VicK